LVSLGFYWQKQLNSGSTNSVSIAKPNALDGENSNVKFVLFTTCGLVLFYFIAIYFVFQAYKEFKGVMLDNNGSG